MTILLAAICLIPILVVGYFAVIKIIKGLLALHFAKTQDIAYQNAAGGDTVELRTIGRMQIAGCAVIVKNSDNNEFVYTRDTAELIIHNAKLAAHVAAGFGDITEVEANEFLEEVKNILHPVLFANRLNA